MQIENVLSILFLQQKKYELSYLLILIGKHEI